VQGPLDVGSFDILASTNKRGGRPRTRTSRPGSGATNGRGLAVEDDHTEKVIRLALLALDCEEGADGIARAWNTLRINARIEEALQPNRSSR